MRLTRWLSKFVTRSYRKWFPKTPTISHNLFRVKLDGVTSHFRVDGPLWIFDITSAGNCEFMDFYYGKSFLGRMPIPMQDYKPGKKWYISNGDQLKIIMEQ